MPLLFRPVGSVIAAVVLPLAFAAFGLWQAQRAAADLADLEARRGWIAAQIAAMDARPGPGGGVNPDWRFTRHGRTYGGQDARSDAQEALGYTGEEIMMTRWRRYLAPVVTASGAIVAGLGCLILTIAVALGRAGRRSRERLIAGFSLVQHMLPALLMLLIVVSTVGVVAAVIFETLVFKATVAGLFVIGLVLIMALRAVLRLRQVPGLYDPEPPTVLGRAVSAQEAPGLWQLATTLGQRLGAAPPDAIVVGLPGGFFVTAGPVGLEGTDQTLSGNVLYVPLPYLAFHREDEVAFTIGHELAHFAGQDTAYGKRADPVHDGIIRSLDALVAAGTTGQGWLSPLIRPTLSVAIFVMDQFYHAAQGWSRRRELAADAASAALVSPDAAARTLLRQEAVRGLVDDVLASAWEHPGEAPPDLVAAIVARAARHGLDDPTGRLDDELPHPSDSHPPTRERLAAFGQGLPAAMIAEVTAPLDPGAAARLGGYLADPEGLAREETARFVAYAAKEAQEERAGLAAQAAAIGDEAVPLHEYTTATAVVRFAGSAILLGGALALALLKLNIEATALAAVISILGIAGLACAGNALLALRRARHPFLVLHCDSFTHRHLDRPIAWSDVVGFHVYPRSDLAVTELALREDAPFPRRVGGWWRIKVDAERRFIRFKAEPPLELGVAGFTELMHRYLEADQARRTLDGERPPP